MTTTTVTKKPIRDFPIFGNVIGTHTTVKKDGNVVVDKRTYPKPKTGKGKK